MWDHDRMGFDLGNVRGQTAYWMVAGSRVVVVCVMVVEVVPVDVVVVEVVVVEVVVSRYGQITRTATYSGFGDAERTPWEGDVGRGVLVSRLEPIVQVSGSANCDCFKRTVFESRSVGDGLTRGERAGGVWGLTMFVMRSWGRGLVVKNPTFNVNPTPDQRKPYLHSVKMVVQRMKNPTFNVNPAPEWPSNG